MDGKPIMYQLWWVSENKKHRIDCGSYSSEEYNKVKRVIEDLTWGKILSQVIQVSDVDQGLVGSLEWEPMTQEDWEMDLEQRR